MQGILNPAQAETCEPSLLKESVAAARDLDVPIHIHAGGNLREFLQIVIVSDSEEAVSPCGACRQVLAEFAPNLKITALNLHGAVFESSLETLLPRAKTGILDIRGST